MKSVRGVRKSEESRGGAEMMRYVKAKKQIECYDLIKVKKKKILDVNDKEGK